MNLKRFISGAVTGLMGLSLFASPVADSFVSVHAEEAAEQSMNIATFGELVTLDSAIYNDVPSSDMMGQVFEGLYRVAQGTEVELGQAEEVDISDDGLVYTFTLREDNVWSNGDPVTAEDFVYTYQRLVDPESGSVGSAMRILKNAQAILDGEVPVEDLGVKALDDLTLEITLEYPAAYFPKMLTGSRFLPVHKETVEEHGDSYGTNSDTVVFNGPFKLEGWSGTNLEWTLLPNEDYWDAENVYLDEVNVSVVKEAGTGADLFDAGELDYVTLSEDFVMQYQGSEEYHSAPKATAGYLSFNTQREATGNAALRRAIAQAYDKETYAEAVIQDGSQAIDGWVPRDYDVDEDGNDFRDESGPMLEYDVEQAQKDWEQAKEELGFEEITLELLTSDVDLSGRTAEYLQAQLEENLPGLTLTIRSVPLQNRLEFQRASDFDIFYGTWAPDYQDALNFLEQYTTDGGINFAKYSNEEYDEMIDRVKNELANEPEERRQVLIEAEHLAIGRDAVAAPLYQVATSYLLNPDVENFEVFPFGRTINLRPVSVK